MIQPLFDTAAAPHLVTRVKEYVLAEGLFTPGDRVLVAVSGGPDSVALLSILHRLQHDLGLTLGVGHFDHGLRGRESQKDAAFVTQLAKQLNLPCHGGTGDVRDHAEQGKISRQMAARRLRLEFLREICHLQGYQKIALGHTADDQVELFFLRLLRGAGPEGLKGMWPLTPTGLVRPLLAVGKQVLLAWLKQENLAYREDASNLSTVYLRNRVRLHLLPHLAEQYNPRLPAAIWRLMALLQDEERLLAAEMNQQVSGLIQRPAPDLLILKLPQLLPAAPAFQRRALRYALGEFRRDQDITSAQTAALLALARGAKSGGLVDCRDCLVARAGSELHFLKPLPASSQETLTLPSPSSDRPVSVLSPAGWHWRLALLPRVQTQPPPSDPWRVWLDADRLALPLAVRHFLPGDRFHPLGAPGPRKLQDFLVDCKVPRWLRPFLPLVTAAGHIIWLPGLRIADPVKITTASLNVLEITLQPAGPEAERLWPLFLAFFSRR